MEKTPNYQLSQWAKTDRILMEDFNADNANLEAALSALSAAQTAETSRVNAALAQKATTAAFNSAKSALQAEDARLDSVKLEWVTLMNTTYAGNGGTELSIPVNGLTMGNCLLAMIEFTLPNRVTLDLSCNGGASSHPITTGSHSSLCQIYNYSSSNELYRLLFFPMKNPDIKLACHTLFNYFQAGYSGTTYRNLTQFTFKCTGQGEQLHAGDYIFRIYGLK